MVVPERIISHYRLLERLGEGGMGVVYKAEDRRLHRFVALKLLSDHISNVPVARDRFHREAEAASALNHPGICTLVGVCDHRIYNSCSHDRVQLPPSCEECRERDRTYPVPY